MRRCRIGFQTLVVGILLLSLVGVASAIPPEATPDRPHESPTADDNLTVESTASSPTVSAQSDSNTPTQVFEKTFSTNTDEVPNDLLRTTDGNYVFMGAGVNPDSSFDAGISKVAPGGKLIWSNTIENSANQSFYGGKQTADGGFVIGGYTEGTDTDSGWLVKLDSNGHKEWTRTFTYGQGGSFNDAVETTGGEFLFAGEFEASDGTDDAEVLKTTSDGTIKWNFSYAHSDHDRSQDFFAIAAGSTDRYHLAGQEYNDGNWDALAVEINSVGEEQFSSTYGHDNLDDWFTDVAIDSDGDPYYSGLRNGIYDEPADVYDFGDAWIYHDGFSDWSQTVSNDDANIFSSIDVYDDTVVVSGWSTPTDSNTSEGLAAAFDTDGIQEWTLTTTDSYSQGLEAVVATDTGAFFAELTIGSEGAAENITLAEYTTQPLLSTSVSTTEIERGAETNLTLTVTNSSTGLPVADATISNTELEISTTTNESGIASIAIDHDTEGNYSIQVTHPEYYDTSTTVRVIESTPVELTNVELSGEPVTNESGTYTLTFHVKNISADGHPDAFTVRLPSSVQLDGVESVTVGDTNTQPSYATTGNKITFEINPDSGVENQQRSVEVNLQLSSAE